MALGHVPYHLALREDDRLAGARGGRAGDGRSCADRAAPAHLAQPVVAGRAKAADRALWLAMVRRARPWVRDAGAGHMPMRGVARYGAGILASEAMVALRTQGDNIIAALLGTQALGVYYFAFNAGLGIVSSLVGAYRQVVFPHLRRAAPGHPRVVALRKALLGGCWCLAR
jgi:hypothetical protein